MKTRADHIREIVDAHEWATIAPPASLWTADRIRCDGCGEDVTTCDEATADIKAALEAHEHGDAIR